MFRLNDGITMNGLTNVKVVKITFGSFWQASNGWGQHRTARSCAAGGWLL
jgi:hypothetical protein